MHLVALLLTAWSFTQPATDTVVVCPAPWQEALGPWIEYRRQQGHTLELIDTHHDPATLRDRIRQAAARGPVRWLLLVGDAPPEGDAVSREALPTFHLPAKVNVRFGAHPQLATDLPYADLDGNGVPDLAVGRWPAHSRDEVAQWSARAIAYERRTESNHWRRRINIVAATGGFGALADLTLESSARSIVARCVPPAYDTTLTYANWRSAYCPPAARFRDTALDRHNEGCLLWVYMGHADRHYVDVLHTPRGLHPILHRNDASRLRCTQGAPIAVFLACHTAAFDGRDDCLAESMLRAPLGPVAVIGGSRVTMPYGMTVLGWEMLNELFGNRRATLGELLLEAKRTSLLAQRDDPQSRTLDGLAQLLNPLQTNLADERAEQAQLFHLLGDPLLRLSYPESIDVETTAAVVAGERLQVRGRSPLAGTAEVELVVRRDRLPVAAPLRQRYDDSAESQQACQALYQQVNNTRLLSFTRQLPAGAFELEFDVPLHASGACHVRIIVDTPAGLAIGSADVEVSLSPTR